MKIHFETLGCRLNQDETEGAARSFKNAGHDCSLEGITAKSMQDDDVGLCIINTCAVTGKAEQKARRLIRLLLDKFPNAPVLVTGCYSDLDRDDIVKLCPERIAILPGTRKFILAMMATSFKGEYTASAIQNFIDSALDSKLFPVDNFSLYTPVFEKHSRASLKIQDGCNCICTYCKIRLARGKSISLDPLEVLRRVKELEKLGTHEVVFTGVNLSQYSAPYKDGRMNFGQLLQYVLDNTSSICIRISSFYPQHITEDLCMVLANPRVQPFFHLSIQAGSDSILKAMKRPYKASDVYRSVELLRSVKENPFISCDIIAGFPGESDDDFELTKKMCQDLHFAWIHAFPFSPRKGTEAWDMPGKLPENVKGQRVAWLTQNAVQEKENYVELWIGKTLSAITENSRSLRMGRGEQNVYHAVTQNFIHVEFISQEPITPGTLVNIKITRSLKENIVSGKETEAFGVLV